jgi:hypothetical protein
MTMEILNLKTVKNQQKDGLLAEYKKLYLHSIPSFYQALVDEEETLLKGVLDALAYVGFADLKWAKMYRQRMACQADLDRLDASIVKTKEKSARRQANLNALQIALEEMKKEEQREEHLPNRADLWIEPSMLCLLYSDRRKKRRGRQTRQ